LGLETLQCLPARVPADAWNELVEKGKAAHGADFEIVALAASDSGRPSYHRRLLARLGPDDRDLRRFLSYLFVSPDRETSLASIHSATDRVGIKKCQEWCRTVLEHDYGPSVVADWEAGLLVVLNNLLQTGSVAASITDIAERYELDDHTMSLIKRACEQFRWHPIFGALGDRGMMSL
jgi:hypothetical protein